MSNAFLGGIWSHSRCFQVVTVSKYTLFFLKTQKPLCQKRTNCRCCGQVRKEEKPSPCLGTLLMVSTQACAFHVQRSAHQPRDLGNLYPSSTSWHRKGDQGDRLCDVAAACGPPGAAGRAGGEGLHPSQLRQPGGGAMAGTAAAFLSCVTVCIVFLGTVHP